MAYSNDLRKKVILCVENGEKRLFIAKLFNIGEKTIRRWISLKRETGDIKPRAYKGGRRSKIVCEELKEFVHNNPSKTLYEIAKNFNCSISSIWRHLNSMNHVCKKKLFFTKNEMQKKDVNI